MSRKVSPYLEFLTVAIRNSFRIIGSAERGTRWRLLLTYLRIKVKSGWFAVFAFSAPRKERILGWEVAIGNYSDFVFLFEEIFVAQNYRCQSLSDRPVVFDCGANIGMAALYFKYRYSNARVVCIEPEPSAFESLKLNIRQNGLSEVTLHNVALGGQRNRSEFYYSKERPASPLAGQFRNLTESRLVDVVPLSTLIDGEVDLIKLDVEGAETEVIRDLAETQTLGSVDCILLEYHHHLHRNDDHLSEVLGLLESSGFGYQIVNARFGEPGQYQDLILSAYRKNGPLR